MTKTEFKTALKGITAKGKLSKRLAVMLPDDQKKRITEHIVRHRGPVIIELIPSGLEFDAWLNCMGYLYKTTEARSGYTFRHTCEHTII